MHDTGSFSLGSSDQQGHTTIRREAKHFYHFVQGGNPAMNMIRRETMFINILEGLHPLEAEIVTLCKAKDLVKFIRLQKMLWQKHTQTYSGVIEDDKGRRTKESKLVDKDREGRE